jgi:predicted HicB family RNase H-like nuclease
MARSSIYRRHFLLAFMSDFIYPRRMKRPVGRPSTGNIPQLSIRMNREALSKAKERAKAEGTTVGRWLEEAIREKMERDSNGT